MLERLSAAGRSTLDAVIVANVVHIFSPAHNLDLPRRIRESVSGGSRLLLVDFWTNATHTQPLFAALMAGAFLLRSGEGDVYSVEEVEAWLRESGWRLLEHQPLTVNANLLVAESSV